jgi:hypothetical protein
MGRATIAAAALGAGLSLLASAGAMAAARPENDKRADAVRLSGVPSRTTGTTVRARAEGTDPEPSCAPIGPTVWYRLPGSNGKTAIVLRALGQLEAVVGVYRIDRSHITGLGCSKTDAKGLAGLAFRARPRTTYLLLVGQREGSIPGKFELVVQKPESAARPPGRPLPEAGSWASVNRLLDPDDSWATHLVAGTTYMINLVASSERCLRFELYRSTVPAFRGKERIEEFGCDGFRTFTPGPDGGGTYTVRVIRDGRYRGTQNYRLQVAPATVDDGAPGIPLQNGETSRGSLNPRTIDVRDVYRFASPNRSMLTAELRNAPDDRFDLMLLTDTGSPVDCACDQAGPVGLHRVLDRGRYYLVVRSTTGSKGSYKLTLLVREVTNTQLLLDGSTSIEVVPDQAVQAVAQVTSATGGPSTTAVGGNVRFQFDRLDPFSGWQFVQLHTVRVAADGAARLTWVPPSVGHWRAHAVFWGTLGAAPSETGNVTIDVQEPIPGE